MKKILLIDDDKNIVTTLKIHLEERGMEVLIADSGRDGVALFKSMSPDVVFLDLRLPDTNGVEVLKKLVSINRDCQVVIITAFATIDTAVNAIKSGAFDYLPKPFTPSQVDHVLGMIQRFRSLESEVASLRGIVQEGGFITRNRKMLEILKKTRQAAESEAVILITGESGTGKEILASLIHDWSSRAARPFVTVDCAALQENLLESDLFGHIRGAFTGALRDKVGKLSLANGGTVFLDEVSEMPPAIQGKFLRFLQNREFEVLGNPKPVSVDVRVLAATNRDLEEWVHRGNFREDLFYRLNVVEIFLPPLRERPEDIQILAEHYIDRFSRLNLKRVKGIDEKALSILQAYHWPGNIRELVNTLERGTVLTTRDVLTERDLPDHIINYRAKSLKKRDLFSLEEVEKAHIRKVLLHASSLEDAAQIMGIDPATLWRKRKKYNLD